MPPGPAALAGRDGRHRSARRDLARAFAAERGELATGCLAAPPIPARYRDVIVTVAELVLLAIVTRDVSDADSNAGLRAAYPEWFDEPGCAENTCHQRFSRARADVRGLLCTIISRDDLYP